MGNRLIDSMEQVASGDDSSIPGAILECANNAPVPKRDRQELGEEYFTKQALAALHPTKVNAFCDGTVPGMAVHRP